MNASERATVRTAEHFQIELLCMIFPGLPFLQANIDEPSTINNRKPLSGKPHRHLAIALGAVFAPKRFIANPCKELSFRSLRWHRVRHSHKARAEHLTKPAPNCYYVH